MAESWARRVPVEREYNPGFVLPRVVHVGLSGVRLTEETLGALLSGFEERIREYLRRRLRRRIDEFEIVVSGEYDGEKLDVTVDVRVVGRVIAPISYEEVLAEAIEEAGRWLEEQLRRVRGEVEAGRGEDKEGGGGDRDADSGHGA